jgi:hypothetical protein
MLLFRVDWETARCRSQRDDALSDLGVSGDVLEPIAP